MTITSTMKQVQKKPLYLPCFHRAAFIHKKQVRKTWKRNSWTQSTQEKALSSTACTGVAYAARKKFSLLRWMQKDRMAKQLAGAKSCSQTNEMENKMDGVVQFLKSEEFLIFTPMGHSIFIPQPCSSMLHRHLLH